ncbi:MAG: M67 family metallopeptidase [Caldiserica bacterium]|nr:M67 family metallopeptidase [Caldisericota bacterium]
MGIRIKKSEYQKIIEHCKKGYPCEACGILSGKDGAVERVYPMENVSDKPQICYFMKPEEQLRVFKEMRQLNLEMVAIYHSHINTAAYPSQRDVELAFYPDASYLILSLFEGEVKEVRSFRIRDNKISEEELQIIED